MSTKTTFKRIALVAVASMGFGMLSVVAANATAATVSQDLTMTLGSATSTATVGTAVTNTAVFAGTAVSAAACTITTTESFPTDALVAGATSVAGSSLTAATLAAQTSAGGTLAPTTTGTSGAWSASTTLSLTPDKPGIYVITFASTASACSTTAADNTTALSATWTIYAGYSADSLRANRVFPTQGSNVTTGWAATAGGQATVRITGFSTTTARTYYVTTDNGSIIAGTERDTNTNIGAIAFTNGANLSGGFNFALDGSSNAADAMDVTITDLGAATTTVSVKYFDASTGVATTFAAATVTWGVAAAASAQYSLLTLNAGAGTTATGAAADTTATTVSKAVSATKNFTIQVVVKDQYDAALNAKTISATITGPGLIGIADGTGAGAATGRSLSQLLTNNAGSVSVWADGSAGEATITISVGTTVLGTKTVTFVGAPAKATVTQVLKVAAAGSRLGAVPNATYTVNTQATYALSPAFTAVVTDANGNDVAAGSTVKMTSSDSTIITVGSCVEYTAYPGNFECSVNGATGAVSGSSATVTFSVYNAATLTYDIVGTPLTFSIGKGTVASAAWSFDKADYAPGEAAKLTLTLKDSAGNAVADGDYTSLWAAAPVYSKSVQGSVPTADANKVVGGVKSYTQYASVLDGEYSIKSTAYGVADAYYGTSVSASATVTGNNAASQAAADAAAEATDAANAATDAANAAAEAADAATAAAQDAADAVAALSVSVTEMVNALKKQITSLTNLVIKIQKKVRA